MAPPPRAPFFLPPLLALAAAQLELAAGQVGQTPWQRALVAKVSANAAARAAEAVPALLARLGATDVREALLRCCPTVAGLAPAELLQRLRDEFAVSEFASAFPVRDPPNGTRWNAMTLSDAENSTHLESQWEVWLRHGQNVSATASPWFPRLDYLETGFYGLQPFAELATPTLQEARYRGPYVGVNAMRIDAGSPLFGDVAAILSPGLARSTFLLSPFDSGSWVGMCNATQPNATSVPGPLPGRLAVNRSYAHNCSAFPGFQGLGTVEHFEHLLLTNERYWPNASTFVRRLERLFGGVPLVGMDFVTYIEAMPAATVSFHGGVKFFVASFPSLFGTADGERLRAWCRAKGWALAWSPWLDTGINPGDGSSFWRAGLLPGLFPSNQRVLDPGLAVDVQVNASASSADTAAADAQWLSAAAARAVGPMGAAEWEQRWEAFGSALSPGLRLEPLRAGSCQDLERCLGVAPSGACVCYQGRSGAVRAAQQLEVVV